MKRSPSKLEIASLNTLGNKLQSKTRTANDAAFIRKHLPAFMAKTSPPTPRGERRKDYRLSIVPQDDRFDPKSAERRLEARLWRMFESGSFPFFDGIGQIISFQVPIYSEKKKHGWGSIDLLGMDDSDGYPVVIELKIAKKTIEPALRAVIEAVSYMIALRGNWADFAPEWSKRTKRGEISAPKTLTALVLAPSDYWTTVEGDEYLKDALRNLKDLVNALADCCYAVRFGSIEAKDSGDWRITGAAKEISIPFP